MSPLRRIYNYNTQKYEFIPVASGGVPSASAEVAVAAATNFEITENTITYKRTGGSSSIENIQKDLLDTVLFLEKLKSPSKK
jgi:hypothetical protein